ncbi:MAG TPA: hypothetical protein VNM66_08400 [Thermodesulfobacteriota bacterium]|nr:hypothetical protein [Thermodesulfobacteriota bacterium]
MGRRSDPSEEIARRLIEHEAGGRHGTDALAQAAERTCERLREHLAPLIGPMGFRVLLASALDLARSKHPLLRHVDVRAEQSGCLSGLTEAAKGREPAEFGAAIAALFGGFIGLLESFIGESLTLRLIRKAFPGVTWRDGGEGHRKSGA